MILFKLFNMFESYNISQLDIISPLRRNSYRKIFHFSDESNNYSNNDSSYLYFLRVQTFFPILSEH